MMIEIEFTEEEKKALNYERYNHPLPRVQRRMEALWLKSQGEPHKRIAQLTGISLNAVTNHIKDYKSGGIDALKKAQPYRPESQLKEHTETIEEYFKKYPPASMNEAVAKIEELTGLKRSRVQVQKFLKGLGFKFRKMGMIPSKADPVKQEDFKKKF